MESLISVWNSLSGLPNYFQFSIAALFSTSIAGIFASIVAFVCNFVLKKIRYNSIIVDNEDPLYQSLVYYIASKHITSITDATIQSVFGSKNICPVLLNKRITEIFNGKKYYIQIHSESVKDIFNFLTPTRNIKDGDIIITSWESVNNISEYINHIAYFYEFTLERARLMLYGNSEGKFNQVPIECFVSFDPKGNLKKSKNKKSEEIESEENNESEKNSEE